METEKLVEIMLRILVFLFPRNKRRGADPEVRKRLKEIMDSVGLDPLKGQALAKLIFRELWLGIEDFKPLTLNEKYWTASMILYRIYGPGISFKSEQFLRDADGAGLNPEEVKTVIAQLWGQV